MATFHTQTAQPLLTGCEDTTPDDSRETRGRELCDNREARAPPHPPAALAGEQHQLLHACTGRTRTHARSTEALLPEGTGELLCAKHPREPCGERAGAGKGSDLSCYTRVQADTSRPQRLRHLRSVLQASTAGHTGKSGLQRGSGG